MSLKLWLNVQQEFLTDAADHGASISVNFDLDLHFGVPVICLDDEKNTE